MKTADIMSIMAEIAPVIREYTALVLAPLSERVAELGARIDVVSDGADKAARTALEKDLAEVRAAVAGLPPVPVAADLLAVVREQTAHALAPLSERLAELGARIDAVSDGADKAARAALEKDLAEVRAAVAANHVLSENELGAIVNRVLAKMPAPRDGVGLAGALIDRDGDLVVTLSDGRQQRLGPVVGKSVDERVLMQRLCGQAADAVEALKADVQTAMERVSRLEVPDIAGMIADAVRALPVAPSIAEMQPAIEAEVARAVGQLPKPGAGKDGRGIASMLIDRAGELVATMTDGRVEKLGPVVGRDGDSVDWTKIETTIAECVKALPQPKDGDDGLGFDDLDLEESDDGVFLVFARGERTKRFRLPMVVDRGVFKAGASYGKGSGVTWGGSFWIAQTDTADKPGETGSWRLAVKKGRDGKDAKP